jgi:hypothetical protein
MAKKIVFAYTKLERSRQKTLLTLLEAYCRRIMEPNTLVLPYVFSITWNSTANCEFTTSEFVAVTDNVIFAAMLFEASQLQAHKKLIFISKIYIVGMEPEYLKMQNNG